MLKFITEEYLKDLYKKESFTEFNVKSDERLTPGGRQYLLDKGIKINNNLPTKQEKTLNKQDVKDEVQEIDKDSYSDKKINQNKLLSKLRSLEALFLKTSIKMFNYDIKLTQNIVDLGRYIKLCREFIDGKKDLEIVNVKNIYGENIDFELTDVYIHLKNSEEVLSLYYLFCKLEELKYEIMLEVKDIDLLEGILKYIYHIEATLSGMIKKEAGER